MTTTTLISVSEYLSTSFRPDCDFVDGEVLERNLGEYDHNRIQMFLGVFFYGRQEAWRIRVAPEQRMQVKETRFRVSDFCVLSADAPVEQVVHHPPLVCIEVLSPSDTVGGMRERVRDDLNMGVREVWLLDPQTRSAMVCVGNTMTDVRSGVLKLAGTPIELPLKEIFSILDQE